jgi:hypothetical protein
MNRSVNQSIDNFFSICLCDVMPFHVIIEVGNGDTVSLSYKLINE